MRLLGLGLVTEKGLLVTAVLSPDETNWFQRVLKELQSLGKN